MKCWLLLVVIVIGAVCATSTAQCPCSGTNPISVVFTPAGAGTASCCVNASSGLRDVTISISSTTLTDTTIVLVTASSDIQLGRVTVTNTSNFEARLRVRGSQALTSVGGVGWLTCFGSSRDVVMDELRVVGDVGFDRPSGSAAIEMDGVVQNGQSQTHFVGGSIRGNIISLKPNRSFGPMTISGNLEGGLSLGNNSSLLGLEVEGVIGPASGLEPVSIDVPGDIYKLVAQAIRANISTANSGGFGNVHRFETTGGNFIGSLSAQRLVSIGTPQGVPQTAAQVTIDGDLAASITLVRDSRVSMLVSGTFLSTRNVGAAVNNVMSFGAGLGDGGGASTDTLTVEGGFAGSLSLGPALTTSLGAFNRNIVINGDLTGSITTTGTNTITSGSNAAITIGGDVTSTGSITLGGDLKAGNTIRIGHDLLGTIQLPGNGLKGQIIVNANNDLVDPGTWTGTIRVDGVTLSPDDEYTQLSASLGGGAAGVAPFKLHKPDCAPAYADNPSAQLLASAFLATPPSGVTAAQVIARSYGPMKLAEGQSPSTAVVVEVQNEMAPSQWFPMTQFFTVSVFPNGDKRIVRLTRASGSVPYPGIYRIVSVGLVSDQVTDEPALDWPTSYPGSGGTPAYIFHVGADCGGPSSGSPPNGVLDYVDIFGSVNPPISPCSGCDANGNWTLDWCEMPPETECRCDWNESNTLSVQDVFDFLTSYFSGVGDFNQSGSTTVQHIFDFLACYFAPPSSCDP